MESSSSPSSSSSRQRALSSSDRRREKSLYGVILPSIRGRSCPICLENIEDRGRGAAVVANCLHAYCLDCIRKWSRLRRRCPLCNAEFGSWFRENSLRRESFLEERLPSVDEDDEAHRRAGSTPLVRRRAIRRSRDELNGSTRQTRPDPWRRSFGRPGSVPPDVLAARKIQWRARNSQVFELPMPLIQSVFFSVYSKSFSGRKRIALRYNRHLKFPIIFEEYVVSVHANKRLLLHLHSWGDNVWCLAFERNQFCHFSAQIGLPRTSGWKERILQRIEPWIRRELEAILGDPDPSVIVHVVTSVFISAFERKLNIPHGQLGEDVVASLRPFLHDRTNMFWHKLRCFAESSLSMETYDAVVEYRKLQ